MTTHIPPAGDGRARDGLGRRKVRYTPDPVPDCPICGAPQQEILGATRCSNGHEHPWANVDLPARDGVGTGADGTARGDGETPRT